MCVMWNPSVHVHLAVLLLKWCIFCLSLPRCPLFWSVWTRQITPHADVSMSEDGSGNECCKCFSEVTVDLTTNRRFWFKRRVPLCSYEFPIPVFAWLFFFISLLFFLLTSSTSDGQQSLGHPKPSWIGALAEFHLLVSQLMGSWQPFSLYKDRVQAVLWCCQTMTSTGFPADFLALSPWE